MKKISYEVIKASFEKEGYTLLTKTYENSRQKLEYICPMDHKHFVIWGNWNSKKKSRCPYCNGNGKPTIEHIRAEFAKEDYTLLTTVYEGNKQKLEYICPRGHRHSIGWTCWKQNIRCPCFSNTMKLNIEHIRAEFAKEGYILLTMVYKNSRQKLKYICSSPKKHGHSITWNNWQRGSRCPFCNNTGISKWEKEVKSFISESNINYIPNDRTQLINPETGYNLELDMWMPDLNKAIECNGVYWHSKERMIKTDKIK